MKPETYHDNDAALARRAIAQDKEATREDRQEQPLDTAPGAVADCDEALQSRTSRTGADTTSSYSANDAETVPSTASRKSAIRDAGPARREVIAEYAALYQDLWLVALRSEGGYEYPERELDIRRSIILEELLRIHVYEHRMHFEMSCPVTVSTLPEDARAITTSWQTFGLDDYARHNLLSEKDLRTYACQFRNGRNLQRFVQILEERELNKTGEKSPGLSAMAATVFLDEVSMGLLMAHLGNAAEPSSVRKSLCRQLEAELARRDRDASGEPFSMAMALKAAEACRASDPSPRELL